MSDKHIIWFSNISNNDINLVGKKAVNLGELFNAKFPTPQGFTITTEAFQFYLRENKIEDEIKSILKKIDISEIQNLIANAKMPKEMKEEILEAYDNFNIDLSELKDSPGALSILKSSREPIFVSIKASVDEELSNQNQERRNFINIRENNELIDKIKICFTYPFTPSSILFRKKNGLDDFVKTSVIIQKMVNSDKSGTIFTKTENVEDENILIEVIFGCGDISKKIIPDIYELTREMEIVDEKISDKKLAIIRTGNGQTKFINLPEAKSSTRVLKTYEIKQLTEIAIKIEKHFKNPQAIQFAIENENLHIVGTKEIKKQKGFNDEENLLPIIKTNTKIKIIANAHEDTELATNIKCDGIGLIKIDKIIARGRKHPLRYEEENLLEEYQEMIEEYLKKITDSITEKNIWIRTTDIQSDKYGSLLETHGKPERNPALGNHGIRFSLKHKNIFEKELLAIKNTNENKNIGIMLPQVISPDEIKQTKELLKELDMDDIKLGISIETPAAAILIKDICDEEINFISINIDNLTEYTLAAEEENDHIQEIFQAPSWAILKLISRVIRECKSNNIETSIYGKATNKEQTIEFLIKRGIDSITTNPANARKLSELIYKLENGKDYTEDIKENNNIVDVSEDEKIGNNLQEGGESQTMKEENSEMPEEPVEEDMEKPAEENPEEVSTESVENEHKEENLKNPTEPEIEPVEQHNQEKENPEEEPISEEKPRKEDIFN